jgi:hypothetical protein
MPSDCFANSNKHKIASLLHFLLITLLTTPTFLCAYNNNQPASVVIGQVDMNSNGLNQGYGLNDARANTLYWAGRIFQQGTQFFIADRFNHRVLIFNSVPAANNASSNLVIGQPNLTSNTANNGGLGANTLNRLFSCTSDGIRLFVTDTINHRVLIFNTIPTNNFEDADIVIGQPDLSSSTANNGGIGANTLNGPSYTHTDGTRLFVTDTSNHRILIFNTYPTADFADADVVVGQPNFTSRVINNDGLGTNTLNSPYSTSTSTAGMFITDRNNNRVLIFNTIPTANNAPANVVVGQPDMNSNTANNGDIGPNTLAAPYGHFADNNRLMIADRNNNRVLLYNTIPTSNNASADVVIGQPNMTSSAANQGNGPAAYTLNSMTGIHATGTQLFIGDVFNHRILIYDDPTPTPIVSPTPTITVTFTNTPTYTPSITPTYTITRTSTPTYTTSPTASNTPTFTFTTTPTCTPTYTATPTFTITGTYTITTTATPTPSITITATITPTATITLTATISPTKTNSATITLTVTKTATITITPTVTKTPYSIPKDKIISYPAPATGNDLWFYYYVATPSKTIIEIFNVTGEPCKTITEDVLNVGFWRTHWDIQDVAPGIYFYRIQLKNNGNIVDRGIRKLAIVKK